MDQANILGTIVGHAGDGALRILSVYIWQQLTRHISQETFMPASSIAMLVKRLLQTG